MPEKSTKTRAIFLFFSRLPPIKKSQSQFLSDRPADQKKISVPERPFKRHKKKRVKRSSSWASSSESTCNSDLGASNRGLEYFPSGEGRPWVLAAETPSLAAYIPLVLPKHHGRLSK
jgi:hypothetical protein